MEIVIHIDNSIIDQKRQQAFCDAVMDGIIGALFEWAEDELKRLFEEGFYTKAEYARKIAIAAEEAHGMAAFLLNFKSSAKED